MTSGYRSTVLERPLDARTRDEQGREIVHLDYAPIRIEMFAASDAHNSGEKWRTHACAKEPWTVGFIEAIPQGAHFIDIGSNVGSYTLLAVARGLNTISIEPFYANHYMQKENLRLNGWLTQGPQNNVCEVILGALSAQSGRAFFHIGDPRFGSSSHSLGGQMNQTQGFHTDRVATFALDEIFAICPPQSQFYAKIDVDGGELGVLQGAGKCLASPAWQGWMIELNVQHDQAVLDLMKEAGWKIAAQYNMRDGREIGGGVYYASFVRA